MIPLSGDRDAIYGPSGWKDRLHDATGKKGAAREARKLFGRNVIVRALGVRSRVMVSRSPAWEAIANDLGIPLARHRLRGTQHTEEPSRIGQEMAVEEQSAAPKARADNRPSDAVLVDAEKETTLRAIRRLAESGKEKSKEAAQSLHHKYEAGEMTDEQVRQTVDTLLSPAS